MNVEIVDAELVENPCECTCGDCQNQRHCDRASCAQADGTLVPAEAWRHATVIDGEVLGEGWTDSYYPPGDTGSSALTRAAKWVENRRADNVVRVVPTGRECWWRLYSTTDSPLRQRTQDHGVRDTVVYANQPHCLTLVFDHGTMDVVALEFKVNASDGAAPRAIEHKSRLAVALRGPASIDMLTEYPPMLPDYPRHWQQLTTPGDFKHPGNNRSNWRYSDKDWTYNPHYSGFAAADGAQRAAPNPKALRGGE